jgi:hypothetical protein
MQSVRQKLKITEDYAYTNLELSAAQARTGKNEACFKRLLQKYVGASPQKDFSFSMWDYLYNFFHWGAKLKEAESLPDDPLSALVTPLVTPSPTPFGTPTGVEANMWSPDSRNIQKDAAASPAKVCPFPNITFERA